MPQPFTVKETGVSSSGWHGLELSGEVAQELAAERFRIMLLPPPDARSASDALGGPDTPVAVDAPDTIQIGYVLFEGREPWAKRPESK